MVLTDKEWYAFILGFIAGKRKNKNTDSKVSNSITTNKDPLTSSKYATIGITAGSEQASNRAYSTVSIPIMCTGVNIGVSAFVAKVSWNTKYITYSGVSKGDFSGNMNIDASSVASGDLLVVGQDTSNMAEQDFVLFYIDFLVSGVPDSVTKIDINVIKTTGTSMTSSSLLTIDVDDVLKYITPIESNNGYIYFESVDKPKRDDTDITIPGPGNFPIGGVLPPDGGGGVLPPSGGSSSADFSLSGSLGGAGGTGAYIVIEVIQDGKIIGTYKHWVDAGDFKLDGTIPLGNDTPGYGDVHVNIKVEPEDEDNTPYYVLIPANGFSMVITTVVGNDDKTYPKQPIIAQYIDKIEIIDLFDIELISNEHVDIDDNIDRISIIDRTNTDTINIDIRYNDNLDINKVKDFIGIDVESVITPINLDDIIDVLSNKDINTNDIIEVAISDLHDTDNLGTTDFINIDYE